ncbi:MAG: hypothetical protein IJT23_01390 [Clostridia bacterium]|nr:hypothetical protein [Clostridia bacterium]
MSVFPWRMSDSRNRAAVTLHYALKEANCVFIKTISALQWHKCGEN